MNSSKVSIWRTALGLVVTGLIVGGVYFLSMAIELFGNERDPGRITVAALPGVALCFPERVVSCFSPCPHRSGLNSSIRRQSKWCSF